MSLIDREKDIEKINRDALRMAREVADKTGTLMCGNICNTNAYKPNDPENDERLKQMFKVSIPFYFISFTFLFTFHYPPRKGARTV